MKREYMTVYCGCEQMDIPVVRIGGEMQFNYSAMTKEQAAFVAGCYALAEEMAAAA